MLRRRSCAGASSFILLAETTHMRPHSRFWPVALICAFGAVLFLVSTHWKASPQVVVYASQDEVYAEPILQEFTKETGIKVQAVYDSEAVKTVGLANRLL